METTFCFKRTTANPTQWVTEYTHVEAGAQVTLSVNIGTPDSSPRAGTLELAALQFAIALLQGRADTLQREGANT